MPQALLISVLFAGCLWAAAPSSAFAYDKSELIAPEGKALSRLERAAYTRVREHFKLRDNDAIGR